MRVLFVTTLLAGCAAENATPIQAPAAVQKAAPTTPAAPAREVGPDGPSDLAVPAVKIVEDPSVAAHGKEVYDSKGCGGCHQFGSKLVGPDLKGVTGRRSPTWIARMVKYPDRMTKQDPVAKDLFRAHMVQMTDQGVPESDLEALVAYLHAAGK